MRNVLFIAYYFPPIAGSGVFRSAKFAKYLPDFGWQPFVVSTSEDVLLRAYDDSMLPDLLNSAHIWRVPTPQPKPHARLRELVFRNLSTKNKTQRGTDDVDSRASREESRRDTKAVIRNLVKVFGYPLRVIDYPLVDPQLYWSMKIIPLGLHKIRKYAINVIYTSSAPWSSLITGILLRKLTGRPWVMDMRDPWTSHEFMYHHIGWRRRVDLYIERKALDVADKVIVTSPGYVEELRQVYGPSITAKVEVITNGYDEQDFFSQKEERAEPEDIITLGHFGALSWERFKPLLESILLLKNESDALIKIRFKLFGWHEAEVIQSIEEHSLEQNISVGGLLEHNQAITEMQQCDILLLLLGAQPHWSRIIPGKLFEYLRSEKPILGVGPMGVASDLLKEAGSGCYIAADDTAALTAFLRRVAHQYHSLSTEIFHPNFDKIRKFERRALAKKLADTLESVLVPR